ncbi:MAG: 7-carboxy-7-deazaguanine synthase QueE [Clostridia bacterium]
MTELKGYLPITQMFYTINGETTHSGVPTLFIRTYGCNVKCVYCDTPQEGKCSVRLELANIAKRAIDMANEHEITDICITGGEPLVYNKEVDLLAEYLSEKGYTVYIETNGTLPIPLKRSYNVIMDIKVPSANILDGRISDVTQDNLKFLKYKDEVKICFGNLADVVYAFDVMERNMKEDYAGFPYEVLLSPLYGTDEKIIHQVINWVLNTEMPWISKRHIHFQTQLHKVFNVE